MRDPRWTKLLVLTAILLLGTGDAVGQTGCEGSGSNETPFETSPWQSFASGNGASFGDFNNDGFLDVFVAQPAQLYRNNAGVNWSPAGNTMSLLPTGVTRYGSSFGDFDNDGWVDIGIETREGSTNCLALLRNLADGTFINVFKNHPQILDVEFCNKKTETHCWGDFNGDGHLDYFVPTYADYGGNLFFHNRGPAVSPRFIEISADCNAKTPFWGTARPEGAQCADVDLDGDLDMVSNIVVFLNQTAALQQPIFERMAAAASGLGDNATGHEEGLMLFDFDMDGDFDIFIVNTGVGNQIWQNRGDGNFFLTPNTVMECSTVGANVGISAEDWDNDGDMDLTTTHVFRKNMLMETLSPRFDVVTGPGVGSFPCPSLGDADNDGDLDLLLGHYIGPTNIKRNALYSASTPMSEKNHVRFRPVADSDTVAQGLETEYGAAVRVHVANDITLADGRLPVRRRFTASSSGYVNQNEYALHFAIPTDEHTGTHAVFDASIDFINPAELGIWRVDRHVNNALGSIDLADLSSREIKVFRNGKVAINQITVEPSTICRSPQLATTPLMKANATTALPLPTPVAANSFVGIEFSTIGATDRVHLREIVIDGQLGEATGCETAKANIFAWDVTGNQPVLVGQINGQTYSENSRSYITTDFLLEQERVYRLVAHVLTTRYSAFQPFSTRDAQLIGSLDFVDLDPCTGVAAMAAATHTNSLSLAARFGVAKGCPADCWPANPDGTFGDSVVNQGDLDAVMAAWGPNGGPSDIAPGCGDGSVDITDLLAVINNWGPCR